MWDPAQYLRFADERSRPFFDLLGRVGAEHPRLVVDLGCGPGQLTLALAGRWADAQVLGIDSSAEMIARASAMLRDTGHSGDSPDDRDGQSGREDRGGRGGLTGRVRFVLGDVERWQPDRPPDVIVSNAVLQWVPGHLDLLPRWAAALPAGGWLAIQVPGNFDQPSHVILRELAGSARWQPLLAGARLNRQAADPGEYLDVLAGAGCEVDAWETTYLHVLHGEDPVLNWYRGSGLRPVLAALPEPAAAGFLAEYGERMREAYPAAPYGTVLPFRRVFAVARRRGGQEQRTCHDRVQHDRVPAKGAPWSTGP